MKKLRIKENIKEGYKQFNEWKETPKIKKRRMIIFFVFYIFFFAFFFYYIRSIKNEVKIIEKQEDDVIYKTDHLEDENYSFVYTIEENGNTYSFQGNRDDDNYELSEYKYKELLDIYTIKRILKNAKYLLKLEEGTGLVNYKYEITNIDLAKILNINSNIENDVNPIIVYVDKDKNVYQIDCDYTNFMKVIEEYDNYKISLKYGEVNNEESSTN